MKKILLVSSLLLFTVKIFAQQFSQYNTGSLYDSFENVSQRAFTPDTSKQYSFNFLVPNFSANFFLSGNAQASAKSRAFLFKFNNDLLTIDKGGYNLVNAHANAYFLMFKMYTSVNGDQEVGFSAQTRGEGRGYFTDESIALFKGINSFGNTAHTDNNIFNSKYYYQTYNQFSVTYREKINKDFSVGFKLSALLGVEYQKLNITQSSGTFNTSTDSVLIALKGTYQAGYNAGPLSTRDYLPSFRNPGAAISIGATYRTEDAFIIQGNIKDLGFIHWSSRSTTYNFDNSGTAHGLFFNQAATREDSLYNKVYQIVHNGNIPGSFTTPVDGKAELSIHKQFWIDDDKQFKYSPTLVASKELFYPGFVGALVNPVQFHNYIATVTFSYDDLKALNVGTQFMIKSNDVEFFIGSDNIFQSTRLLSEAVNHNSPSLLQNTAYTGASLFLGFSLKFGNVIEHPMNASSIPTGEPGFLSRLWGRLFKTNQY